MKNEVTEKLELFLQNIGTLGIPFPFSRFL